jgi:ABC-type glutathione transport system ATPase component
MYRQLQQARVSSAAGRAPDRLHYGGQPATACGGVEAVGPAGRLPHRPGELPGGQQPRAAIARGLVSQAIVFAGEAAGNLDPRASAEMLGLMRRCLTGFGRTTVMITHDPVAAAHPRRDSRCPPGRRRAPYRSPRAMPASPAPLPAHVGYGSIT